MEESKHSQNQENRRLRVVRGKALQGGEVIIGEAGSRLDPNL